MNYLIIDTETSGLPRFDLPVEDSIQPRLLSLACLLLNEKFEEKASFYSLVKPDKEIFIDPRASECNGITWNELNKLGIPPSIALSLFDSFCMKSDLIIAHNLAFDSFMMDIELSRATNRVFSYDWKSQGFCTMLSMTNVCKLPGRKGFKWPKLIEAFNHCFPTHLGFREHYALDDVKACAEIFKWYKTKVDNAKRESYLTSQT